MGCSGNFQLAFEVTDPVLVVGWEYNPKTSTLHVVMSGPYYCHVQLEQVEEVDADTVKKGVAGMYLERHKAKMPEPIRGFQPTIVAEIDAWFANQSVQ